MYVFVRVRFKHLLFFSAEVIIKSTGTCSQQFIKTTSERCTPMIFITTVLWTTKQGG